MTELPPETHVGPDESPAARCQYCERPFRDERSRALHVGEMHRDSYTDAEREAYEAARDEETEELFGFHMKVIVAIGVVHAVIIALYMIAFGSGFL